jgi:predicted nucleotidyltransferase
MVRDWSADAVGQRVMTTDQYSEIINTILLKAEQVSYVFLFGSAVTRPRSDSDIDVLVGGDLDFGTRMDLTGRLEQALKRHVDLVPARDARPEVVLRAMSKGVRIFVRDNEALKRDYFRVYRAYDDATNLRRIRAEYFKRLYANG